MTRDEKKAFWKFFLTYFISVALLIVTAGYFYFLQMQQHLLKNEHFSLIEYARHLKNNESTDGFKGYTYRYVNRTFEHFSIENFIRNANAFEKWVPANQKGEYILITKKTSSFEHRSSQLLYTLAGIGLALLLFFALLSYLLARNALAPLRQNIEKLDRFAKDLIHDLNTPVTSIGLNLKMLYKEPALKNHRAMERLQKSTNDIAELHKNLTFLLREQKYELEKVDLSVLTEALLNDYRCLYPRMTFATDRIEGLVSANPAALRQILDNLLSNACKYSPGNSRITISYRQKTLSISDKGIGIKHPERAFERNYAEHLHGSGIGLDIVKRLCDMMHIRIEVASSGKGTSVSLTFS